MECHYCHSTHRKFYCIRCLKDKLQTHRYELGPILFECDKAIEQSEQHVASTARIRALRAEKHRRAANITKASVERERIKADNNALQQRIEKIRAEIDRRRAKLDENERQRRSQSTPAEWERELQQYRKRSRKMHQMVILARRILVQEITLLFDFKAGETSPTIHEQSSFMDVPFLPNRERNSDFSVCGVTLPSRTIDVAKYPREELNAAVGLVVHMLGLIVGYLGIKLPFSLFYRGIYPYARSSLPRPRRSSKMPLFLDDENLRRFTIGVAMLNYDIAYLCHTQRVDVPLSQVANTLQNLMQCCRSPKLGIYSHATAQGGLSSLDFSLEFHHVLRATALRFKSGPPIRVDASRGALVSERHTSEGWLYYDGLDDDSEDEDDDWNEDGDHGEHWNLVDAMPSLGKEQGTESIFQQLGASIVPGVLNALNAKQQDAKTSKRKHKS